MSKHTKPPWKVAKAKPVQLRSGCYIQAIFSMSDATYRPARAQGKTANECQANAHLIAASPRLLQSCKRIAARVEALRQSHPEWTQYIDMIVHEEDGLFAAIAEAEGRAT